VTAPLEARERAVLDAVDGDFVVGALRDLVAVPSLPGAESAAQRFVADLLGRIGADVEVFGLDVDALARHPFHSAEFDRPDPLGVIGAVGDGAAGPTLLLNGHVDVVPAGDVAGWARDPFMPTVVGRRLYGRGACDMKAGLAAALAALKAIVDAGVDLPGRVLLTPVVGEEDGGCGTLGALLHGVTADGAIVMEPTRLAVSPAVAGALSVRITITGRAAHGCLREEGVSAIEKLAPVHAALLDLERRRNRRAAGGLFGWLDRPFAICAGRLEAGDWASSEADWLRLEGRYGVAPGEDLADARAQLEEAVADAAAADPWLVEHPPTVEWVGGQFVPGATPVDDPLVTTLVRTSHDVVGRRPAIVGQPYGCDMGLLRQVADIPTVVFGPGDIRQAHAPDEWVDLDDVMICARTLAVTAVRFCSLPRRALRRPELRRQRPSGQGPAT
jgi:acetylornithine deacetylase